MYRSPCPESTRCRSGSQVVAKSNSPVVGNSVWRQVWVIPSADLHTFKTVHCSLFVCICVCLWVHPCINSACVSFGNADSQIGSQLQQWVTQSLALDSIRCHLDNTATHCEVWARACVVLVCVFLGFHFTFQDFINIVGSLCTLCVSYASLCRQTVHCMCKLCMCDGVCLYLRVSSVFFFDLWNSLGPSHTAASL